MDLFDGVNDITDDDINNFLNGDDKGEGAGTQPASDEGGNEQNAEEPKKDISDTQAFARRLKQEKNKIYEDVAKELGYASYAELQKAKENKIIAEAGYDDKDLEPVISKIVEQRIANDPRMKDVNALQEQRALEWAAKELKEVSELTDGKVKELKDLPENVISTWKEGKVSLKQAYMLYEGENMVRQMRASNGGAGTGHLSNPKGNPPPINNDGNKRPLTEKEKRLMKSFNPYMSDDDINKMRYDK